MPTLVATFLLTAGTTDFEVKVEVEDDNGFFVCNCISSSQVFLNFVELSNRRFT